MKRYMCKGTLVALLLLFGFSFGLQTAFAQPDAPTLVWEGQLTSQPILGQTREQLVERLGKERICRQFESKWEFVETGKSSKPVDLLVMYGGDGRAVFYHLRKEVRETRQETNL